MNGCGRIGGEIEEEKFAGESELVGWGLVDFITRC
jgi:hypothetical protein